jgi:hypothetical protein
MEGFGAAGLRHGVVFFPESILGSRSGPSLLGAVWFGIQPSRIGAAFFPPGSDEYLKVTYE